MNTFYPENDYRNYLAHYGVKGMKWRKHKKDRNLTNSINDLVGGMANNMAPNRRRAGSSDPRERYRTKATSGETNTGNAPRSQWNKPHYQPSAPEPGPSTHQARPTTPKLTNRVAAKHIRDHKESTAHHPDFRSSNSVNTDSDWANNRRPRRSWRSRKPTGRG